MARADASAILRHLRSQLPVGWFGDSTPVLTSILSGISGSLATLYSAAVSLKTMARLSTATGAWLDLAAYDFLGTRVYRAANEPDSAFRARVRREILRARVTRAALISELTDLTGIAPVVFEPRNTSDTGGYGVALGYGTAGGYGSMSLPFQVFVTAYRPRVLGVAAVDGYGQPAGGYGAGAIEYVGISALGGVTDDAIRAAVLSVLPAATVCWLRITNAPGTVGDRLDIDFYLDVSAVQ